MIETIQSLNYILALGGIIGLVVITVLIYDLVTSRRVTSFVSLWGMKFLFVVTLGSALMTLVYSEYFGIIPCGLCWLERIMLYPQVILIGTALYLKDKMMPRYGIVLSVFGLIISLYHHYIQMGGSQFIKCPASGAADCAKRFIFEFGFVTFPLLSAILFGFLIVMYIYIQKTNEQV